MRRVFSGWHQDDHWTSRAEVRPTAIEPESQTMAIPSFGGMCIELITLFVVPVTYGLVEEIRFKRNRDSSAGGATDL